MSNNIRHITFSSNILMDASSGIAPFCSQELGIISIPKNKKHTIKNLFFGFSDPIEQLSGVNIYSLNHRFFLSNDPINDIISQVLSPYVLFPAPDQNIKYNDIKTNSTEVYNKIGIYQTVIDSLYSIKDIKLKYIMESIPFSKKGNNQVKDFHFNSNDDYLCFCFFPVFVHNSSAGSGIQTSNYSFSINFDLIQE